MSIRFIAGVALAASTFGLLGCSSFPSTYGLDAGSASMVRQTCNEIMGLRTGPEFEACGGSLADTVRSLQDANLTLQADQACSEQGLVRGTAEQAKCVVKFRRAAQSSVVANADAATVPAAEPWQSYFSMSQSQQAERAELSCAQIGLHPATSGFWGCVSDLRHSIVNIRPDTMP
ncbi:hypothetical protein GCM10011487_58190 [Steroidobacter agaridevorans]|uniref:Lipoprotein n=1 Tax=Steroidobacter agaridevorans TaxID=2695856 RepID=A0A829YKU4_9GAMM|nr:hypothetical protein [Steroidobacter agaridevorans]GFE83819.1 hypothetical protein GCM10011487_58190 [Steroidobacter agaridevorans]GFE91593.1 hypothetical protein GCM10011488_65470 [Steroidobacter agaridevorans]